MKAIHPRRDSALRLAKPVLIVTAVATVIWVNAGDLLPPPGAIMPTNRVQLSDQATTLPFTINSSGSYMLTSSLIGSNGLDGIIIDADDVTLDLNGFSLVGVAGSLDGVRINGARANIAIHNGMIVGWGGVGLNSGGPAEHVRLSNLSLNDNGSHGLLLGSNSHVVGLSARNNGGAAIRVAGQGNRIDECHMTGNDTGLEVVGTDNLIVRNSAWGNTTADFSIAAGNAFGPIVSVGGIGDISINPSAAHPWANFAMTCNPVAEICDGLDNNCNGIIDEGAGPTWCEDMDGDGFGDPNSTIVNCVQQPQFVADCTDCDDSSPTANPGAAEVCDSVDNNCDGNVDEGTGTIWCRDADADGFGDANNTLTSCTQPAGFVADCTDCDDFNLSTNPGATEVCDSVDNNCDGNVDEGAGTLWCRDADGDGFGDANNTLMSCTQPVSYVADCMDCDDFSPTTNPTAVEICDLVDNNCDGNTDEGGAGCGGGQVCVSGACQCPSGMSFCGANCVNTQSDPNNCGGCANVCPGGGLCVASACQAPTCTDSVQNGAETDVDCGGGVCLPCANGLACLASTDCQSGNCSFGICQP